MTNNQDVVGSESFDKLIFGVFFGFLFPACFFLAAFILWFYFFQLVKPLYFVLSGLFTGLLVDLLILKKLVRRRFELPVWFLILTYLFCNLVMFGMFMGFPVFNLFLGIIAGYYFGKRVRYNNISFTASKPVIRLVASFTASVILVICIASGYIATVGEGVGSDLQHMFRLNFLITKAMIWEIIWIGGITLIIAEFWLTKFTMIQIIKKKL